MSNHSNICHHGSIMYSYVSYCWPPFCCLPVLVSALANAARQLHPIFFCVDPVSTCCLMTLFDYFFPACLPRLVPLLTCCLMVSPLSLLHVLPGLRSSSSPLHQFVIVFFLWLFLFATRKRHFICLLLIYHLQKKDTILQCGAKPSSCV